MCGLLGLIDYTKTIDEVVFSDMLSTLIQRGPDDKGIDIFSHDSYSVSLGHRRLAIQDLSKHGHQPMQYDNLVTIYNGEVYNFKEIQQELIKEGYFFESETDTEVILKAFHCWGIKSVDKFRGMFAFAIYDIDKQEITIFRDRVGVKPLYYSNTENEFIFSSELKPLLKFPAFDKSLDFEAVSSYLQFGYIHAPKSIFSAAKKLLPGHYLKFNIDTKKLDINCYWDVTDYFEDKTNVTDITAITDELESIIIESFSLRMISDVPVGTFLSGGVDSSLVTAVLQKHSDVPINTFTIGFEDKNYDESSYAKAIADHLGTNHTEYICKKEDALEIIKELPNIFDEPFADSSAIPTTLVSRLAKEKVSVVLSGDGGDELFCGYSSYALTDKRFTFISKIPFKNKVKKLISFIPLPLIILNGINENLYTKLMKFKNLLDHDDIANAFKVSNSVFCKDEIEKLISQDYFFCDDIITPVSALEKMMISDFKGYLPDDLLVKVDRSTMSVSLEGREPLLDHKIIEFAASMPISLKKNKTILKDILKRYVPKELFLRKKQGFGIPINSWLRNDLKYLLDQYLNEDVIKEYGVFDPKYVADLLRLFYAEKNDDRKIWTLLMFQMWFAEHLAVN